MGNFAAQSYSIMGDQDRSEFNFDTPLTDTELLEMLERNPRIAMQCDWMTAIALENGFTLPEGSEKHLAAINFDEKIHRALMFSRLHGSSMARRIDDPLPDEIEVTEDDDGNELEETEVEYVTANFEVYHRLAAGNGWFLKASDIGDDGQPATFQLSKKIEKGKTKTEVVPASECIIVKNPKKRWRWDGTPSSKLIAHTALLEELLLRTAGKHSLDIAGAFLWFDGVISDEHAAAIHAAVEEKPLNELYTNGVKVEAMQNNIAGSMGELKIYDDMLKDYMACGMRVSRQAMDGAAEGTLSSAEYNTIMTSSTIKSIQKHFTPYIEDILALIGYPDHKIVWNEPIEKLPDKSDQTTKVNQNNGKTNPSPSASQ